MQRAGRQVGQVELQFLLGIQLVEIEHQIRIGLNIGLDSKIQHPNHPLPGLGDVPVGLPVVLLPDTGVKGHGDQLTENLGNARTGRAGAISIRLEGELLGHRLDGPVVDHPRRRRRR